MPLNGADVNSQINGQQLFPGFGWVESSPDEQNNMQISFDIAETICID
jgi:hypothetical protein